MTFINGVRTTRTISKKSSTDGVDYSVIGLIGTAPIQTVDEENRTINKPVLVTNKKEGVKYFGNSVAGENYTIPDALEAIYNQVDSAKVIVINVFDPQTHTATVTTEDENEEEIPTTAPSPSAVTANDIKGEIKTDGTRTGLEAFRNSQAECKCKPKILIAPYYSSQKAIGNALTTLAKKFRARVYTDSERGLSRAAALQERGENGTSSASIFDTKVEHLYPNVKVYNTKIEEYETKPISPYAAGVRVLTNTQYGLHYSIGNQKINGIDGLETPIDFDLQDENSDSNLLNGQGYTTVIYDGGYRFWGNRNSSFPDNENINSFSCVEDVADYIDESIAVASRQFMSGPINTALIDDIVNFGTKFLAQLKLKGWIINGEVWYNDKKNTYDSLAKGKITISRRFLPPAPLEDLEYESDIDITLYEGIGEENE